MAANVGEHPSLARWVEACALVPNPASSLPAPQINALIVAGQWWRLLTPAFLHGNLMHLVVNSYSLNNLGPTVERTAG